MKLDAYFGVSQKHSAFSHQQKADRLLLKAGFTGRSAKKIYVCRHCNTLCQDHLRKPVQS